MKNLSGKAAIVGIGTTGFSRDSGMTELRMTCECIRAALDEAGLVPPDIDGIVKHTDDATDEHSVTSAMGMGNLTYFGESRWDGAPCSMLLRAAIGVAAGAANYVVVYRAVNSSSQRRMRTSSRNMAQMATGDLIQWTFHAPFGLLTESGRVAMIVRRYMHEFGIDRDDFGWIPVVCRENGSRNPKGMHFNSPLTYQDYLSSRSIVEPLRVLDCYEPADAAAALIVTTAERAGDLRQKPVYVLGAAQSTVPETEEKNSFYGQSIAGLPEVRSVGKRLFATAGLQPGDIRVAELDDAYSPLVPMQLEELCLCDPGGGVAFCKGGDRIRSSGSLPLNTSGGSLGEGHLYGMNHVIEAVRQVRGTAATQVNNTGPVLVATGAGGPASGLILGDAR